MRAFLIVLAVCILEAGGLAVLLLEHPASSPAAPAAFRPPTPKPPREFTLVAAGDVALAGEPHRALFHGIEPRLRHADLGIANLEGTLATGGAPRCTETAASGCFVFRASPAWAETLRRVGFTALNVANNHALDFGPMAQGETLAALTRARIAVDGLPGRITYVRAAGVRVALVGTAPYRWAQSLLDPAGTQALVRVASRQADVVVVYMHAGAEGADADGVTGAAESYHGEARGNPRAFAHAMVAAGADFVFASGPHVLRGMEWYRGRLIAYSLGNLASSHTLSTRGPLGQSALLRVTLDRRGRFVRGVVVPLRLDVWGTPSPDPTRAGIGAIRRLSLRDFGAAATRLRPNGTIVPPRR
jgi:Bacterial capsule synthesis protein PGA_cap